MRWTQALLILGCLFSYCGCVTAPPQRPLEPEGGSRYPASDVDVSVIDVDGDGAVDLRITTYQSQSTYGHNGARIRDSYVYYNIRVVRAGSIACNSDGDIVDFATATSPDISWIRSKCDLLYTFRKSRNLVVTETRESGPLANRQSVEVHFRLDTNQYSIIVEREGVRFASSTQLP